MRNNLFNNEYKTQAYNQRVDHFTYLSTSMIYNKEEKEEAGTYQLGNTVINEIF